MRVPGGMGGAHVRATADGFPVHTDGRGTLLAVEGTDVGFPIQRVFTVTGTVHAVPRGGHAPRCRELLVLVVGRATGTVQRARGEVAFDLTSTGHSVRVDPDEVVAYTLDADSVLLVLCDRPYEETTWHAPQS